MTCELPSPIAIDGPAASGKSTLAQALADRFGYLLFDTGLMYRAVALAAVRRGVPADDAAAVAMLDAIDLHVTLDPDTNVWIDGENVTARLREPDVEANVSKFAALPSVRERMVKQQQEIAAKGASVLVGRDIGTVVLPDAPLKFYLDASEEARARRRSRQAGEWGQRQQDADARKDISGRDRTDSTREVSPLRPADDAVVIDTTNLTLDEMVAVAMEKLECAHA
jgi:CMP/dCMP kinase